MSRSAYRMRDIIAAKNAISILNAARVSFSGFDLSHIKVPGAKLNRAIMHHTNL